MPDLRRLPDILPIALAVWLLATLVGVWSGRLLHPFDLEWMEGGMLAHAWRIQRGMALYGPPDASFIPFVYPPGYSTVLAGIGGLGELGYAQGRALSLVGALAAAGALVIGVVRQPERDGVVATGAAAAFLGCYAHSGAFYDLVRPDGLSLGLLAWAIVAALSRRPVWAGLLLAGAFWCKHSAALYGVPLALGLLTRDGLRPALRFAIAAVAPALTATILVQSWSGGHFLRYLLLVPGSHPLIWGRVWPLTPSELGFALPVLLPAVAIAALLVPGRRLPPMVMVALPVAAAAVATGLALSWGATAPTALIGHASLSAALGAVLVQGVDLRITRTRPSGEWVFAVGLGVTALASAMLMRGHQGGYVNVHMPAHWIACLGAGLALAHWRAHDSRVAVPWVVAGLLAAQLGMQRAEVVAADLVPSSADQIAGDALVADLARQRGPVLSPYAVWLPVSAGHDPAMHQIGLMDIDHPGGPYHADVARIEATILAGSFGTVLDANRPIGHRVDDAYRVERVVLPRDDPAMQPRSGWGVKPFRLLVPR
ncbi:MAG: hypothetical protein ACI8PZ_005360 [Myxococcota bacterium]|jgi:hypothetical protein